MAPREDGLARTNLKGTESEREEVKGAELKEEVKGTEQDNEQGERLDVDLWQNNCRGVVTRLEAILSRELWPDCELAVGAKGEIVRAHRLILASASPVLAKLLYSPTNFYLALPNIEAEPFKLLLSFIYTDKITISSYEIACSLYEAAHFLILSHLEKECKTYLLKNISPQIVIRLYEFSKEFNDYEIKRRCLEEMADKAGEILASGGIEAACIDTLEAMFSLPELNINSEIELVKAAERWVHAQAKTELETTSENQSDVLGRIFSFPMIIINAEFKLLKAAEQWVRKRLNIEPTKHELDEIIDNAKVMITKGCSNENDANSIIQKALKHIRFLTIKSEEFAEYDMTFLLSKSVLLAIMLNLNAKVFPTFLTMPEGFSTSREKRSQHLQNVSTDEDFATPSKDLQQGADQVFYTQIDIDLRNRDSFTSDTINYKLDSPKAEINCFFCMQKISYDAKKANCEFGLEVAEEELEVAEEDISFLRFQATVEVSFLRKGIPGFLWSGKKLESDAFYKESLVDWNEILDPKNGYVVDGKISIGLKVNIQSPRLIK